MSDDKRRYSKVHRRIWSDAKFRRLTPAPPNGQTLFLRLLTGPELTNIPGVFAAGEAALSEALGWPTEAFREAFTEAYREGLVKADWQARFVFVPNAIKYNSPESPNVIRSWRACWDELPECSLKLEAHRVLRAFVEGLGEGFRKAFNEALPDPSPNQEQEQEQEGGERASGAEAADPPPDVRHDEPEQEPELGPSLDPKPEREIAKTATGTKAATAKIAKTAKTRAAHGMRLSSDWMPKPEVLERFRTRERVDASRCVERFKNYWLAATGKNAVKIDWNLAFTNWVLRDLDDGKLRKLEDELPILRLPHRDELLRHDIANAPDMTGFSFGATK